MRAGAVDPAAEADEKWLARCIDELIDNALKFSPSGAQVRVTSGPVDLDGVAGVEIAVEDDGPGMPPEQVAGLRSEWAQGDSSDTRRHGGPGLGLALVQRVAEHHGGRLVIGGVGGRGSRVAIVLPALGSVPAEARIGEAVPLPP